MRETLVHLKCPAKRLSGCALVDIPSAPFDLPSSLLSKEVVECRTYTLPFVKNAVSCLQIGGSSLSSSTFKNVQLGSVAFTLEGIRRIYDGLTRIVQEQCDIELSGLVKRADQTDEEFAGVKAELRDQVFKVVVTVDFSDNSSKSESSRNVIDLEANGPHISRIYMSNVAPYKHRTGFEPEHRFGLLLDFSQPALLDASGSISSPTENLSGLTIGGPRDGWVAGIEATVKRQIFRRRPFRTWFHGSFVYDFFQMIIGIPFAFYLCWLSSDFINNQLPSTGHVIAAAAYIYLGFVGLWAYRILFSYTKWAFPLVEITDQSTRPALHRKVCWAIICVVSGKVFWDVADPMLSIRGMLAF
ncbi:hypothetical protein RMR16_019415 [Agrobacterium sp. rho-13.3]